MKKIIIGLVSVVSMIFVVGCAANQPSNKPQSTQQSADSFNPNDKRLVFVEGKPFYVPRRANYSPRRATSKEAKNYQRVGITCNTGDLLWANNLDQAADLKALINRGEM